MPAPIPTETVRTQSERKASPTARGPWPRSQSETTPKTTRNGVALNGRIPANPATRIAAATRSSGRRNRRSRRASRKPPGVTPMPEDPMDRGDYHTVGHRTKPLPHHRQTGLFRPWDRTTSWTVRKRSAGLSLSAPRHSLSLLQTHGKSRDRLKRPEKAARFRAELADTAGKAASAAKRN